MSLASSANSFYEWRTEQSGLHTIAINPFCHPCKAVYTQSVLHCRWGMWGQKWIHSNGQSYGGKRYSWYSNFLQEPKNCVTNYAMVTMCFLCVFFLFYVCFFSLFYSLKKTGVKEGMELNG